MALIAGGGATASSARTSIGGASGLGTFDRSRRCKSRHYRGQTGPIATSTKRAVMTLLDIAFSSEPFGGEAQRPLFQAHEIA